MEPSGFEEEDRLQEYIHENPESIPLYEVKEDINLLILAREFRTNSGRIDALAVDADGGLYIIETKLYENHDKRTVIAQALDYGAGLWKHSGDFGGFRAQLDQHAKDTWGCSVSEKLQNYFDLNDEGLNNLMKTIEGNLDDGILKFVVLMDSLDERLKDLVLYVNQNSQFDVYAVEMKHYQHEEYEIMLPNIFGTEVKKNVGGSGSSNRKSWNEEKFFTDLKQETESNTKDEVRDLYDYFQKNADAIDWGSGKSRGSFIPRFYNVTDGQMFTIFSDGQIRIYFCYMDDAPQAQKALLERLCDIEDLDITPDYDKESYAMGPQTWISLKYEFIDLIESIREDFGGE